MLTDSFLKRYKDYDEQVREYMKMFADSLEEKYGEIPDVFIASLDILAGNLVVMYKSMKDIVNDKVGVVGNDKYRGEKKSTQLQAFMAAQHNVNTLINEFGWTPKAKSKIRENQDSKDIAKYLENLTK